MINKLTSPPVVSSLLMIAGATAIPTALATSGAERAEQLLWGIGIFTFGAVLTVLFIVFKIWKWKHFARVRAASKGWLFAIMNIATLLTYPAAWLHLRFIGRIFPAVGENETIMEMAPIGAWSLNTVALLVTNILFAFAMPHTTLPSPMKVRCSRNSKELNAWRVVLALFFVADVEYLALSINIGAVAGIVAATAYMYVLFSLHAGKVTWKDEITK